MLLVSWRVCDLRLGVGMLLLLFQSSHDSSTTSSSWLWLYLAIWAVLNGLARSTTNLTQLGMKKYEPCQHEARSELCLGFHPSPLGQAWHDPNCAARRGTTASPCGPLGHGPGSPTTINLHIKCARNPNLAVAVMAHALRTRASTPHYCIVLRRNTTPSSSSPSPSRRSILLLPFSIVSCPPVVLPAHRRLRWPQAWVSIHRASSPRPPACSSPPPPSPSPHKGLVASIRRPRLEEMTTPTTAIGDLEEMVMLPQSHLTEDSQVTIGDFFCREDYRCRAGPARKAHRADGTARPV
jgi:hypothetical protein